MANPIDESTGKPRRGRPRKSDRQSDGNGIGDASGAERGNASGTGDASGNDSRGNTTGDGESGTETGATRNTVWQKAKQRIAVESPKENPDKKPRETKPKNPDQKATGAITPAHVESWMVQGFAFAAMVKGADYWAINRPDIEVRPWAGSAAELLNKITGEQAQKLTEINAGVAVCVGMYLLVSKRVSVDRQVRLERAKSQRARFQQEEGVPMPNVDPDVPASQNGRSEPVAGTGARPVTTDQAIFGNESVL